MSKMDNLRAMREAKYAANAARAAGKAPTDRKADPRPPVAPKPVTPKPVTPKAATPEPGTSAPATEATEELCGHRNMGGRTCTRERGHTAKSHRYS